MLAVPQVETGSPRAGRRCQITSPEYAGTKVRHTVYLPADWSPDGPQLPVIFEYTGNYFPQSGSTGEVEDAGLGYCLSGGRFIWVTLPYINQQGTDNERTWWGDVDATVDYAKDNVPRIIDRYNADPCNVFLCGFSRGAIGVSFLGLHDDEVARLWTAFITHDHFDGVRAWKGTTWGQPLPMYREQATRRLQRVANRPFLVCQHGAYGTEAFVRNALPDSSTFTFLNVPVHQIFEAFPNAHVRTTHTDRWAIRPSPARTEAWRWMQQVVRQSRPDCE